MVWVYSENIKSSVKEHITIRYRTKQGVGEFTEGDFAVEKAFRVYKITDMLNHDSRYTYVLHICEPKLFTVTQTRLSKVLRGSYSEILYKHFLKMHNSKNFLRIMA